MGKPPKDFKGISNHIHHNVDVTIIGGGLNGLLAAKSFINSNYDVLLIEFEEQLGGIINNSNKISLIDNKEPKDWLKETIQEIEESKNVKILKNTLVTTYNYINHLIAIEDRFVGSKPIEGKVNSTLHKIRTGHTILCNGHIERFLSFQNNDLPGIMLSSSFEKYMCRYGLAPSKEPVIFSNNSNSNSLVYSLIKAGLKPKAYIDSRSGEKIEPNLFDLIRKNDVPLYTNSQIKGAFGSKKIEKILIEDSSGALNEIKCDCLCLSGGINPDVHLFTQSKGLLDWDEKDLTYKPSKPFQPTITLGSASGQFNFDHLNSDINDKLKNFKIKKLDVKLELNTNAKYNLSLIHI